MEVALIKSLFAVLAHFGASINNSADQFLNVMMQSHPSTMRKGGVVVLIWVACSCTFNVSSKLMVGEGVSNVPLVTTMMQFAGTALADALVLSPRHASRLVVSVRPALHAALPVALGLGEFAAALVLLPWDLGAITIFCCIVDANIAFNAHNDSICKRCHDVKLMTWKKKHYSFLPG